MPSSGRRTAVIIGAGPAGLTAAYELITRTDILPIVLEQDPNYVGGISRTENYKGNRLDLGGHRFFSKSDRVMQWWSRMLPIALAPNSNNPSITYQRSVRALTEGLETTTAGEGSNVMLVRPRKTRIVYGGQFFAYPVELSFDTLSKLGSTKVLKIGITYAQSVLFPIRPERTLEDFFINRFGRELYETFFKSYTEKVWGTSCKNMSAEWGAQRIKGLSITKAITHAGRKIFRTGALSGKGVETSLIEQFLYPALGPGLMWETAAKKITDLGGEIRMGRCVTEVLHSNRRITAVKTGDETLSADYVFSTTDIQALGKMLQPSSPEHVTSVSDALEYRDFISVGLLLEKKPAEKDGRPLTDTWVYIHEPGVYLGRVQFFHNWSPYLVADSEHGWVGLEYFCNQGDALSSMSDAELLKLGAEELEKVGLRQGVPVLDGVVLRQQKAYPGYFGAYDNFSVVREHLNTFENLFSIGRNGMHRYNNQDHSMLAAMVAVDNIVAGISDKSNLWAINTEEEYHESKKT